MSDMTSRELLYIKTIAEEHSITRAAEKLFITQPSLSQAVQRIEASLNTKLFHRTGTRLILTSTGEAYYEVAVKILKLYSDFTARVESYTNGEAGEIRIGISYQFGRYALPVVLPKFRAQFPNINLKVFEGASHILTRSLLSGECDFAVLNCLSNDFQPQFEYDIVTSKPFIIVASRDNPLRDRAVEDKNYEYPLLPALDLSGQQLIMLNPGHRVREASDLILHKAHVARPNVFLNVDNIETAFTLIANGFGITFAPTQYSPLMSIPGLVFYSIPAEYNLCWSTCVMTVKGCYLSRLDQEFIRLVKEFFNP